MGSESGHDRWMVTIALLLVHVLCDCFKSRSRLEAEIVVLRHQLNVLQLRPPCRPHLRWADRVLFVWLYRRFPSILDAITIVRPETVLAPNGIRRLLAMEVPSSRWPTVGR
jgi:hypothetical protein